MPSSTKIITLSRDDYNLLTHEARNMILVIKHLIKCLRNKTGSPCKIELDEISERLISFEETLNRILIRKETKEG